MTYRNFAGRVARDACLNGGYADGQLVFQGDLDIPVFATGNAAEYIVYFKGDRERVELNLRIAIGIAKLLEEGSGEDLDRLTRAALQILLVRELDELPGRLRAKEKTERNWLLSDALPTLEALNEGDITGPNPELEAVVLDLRTRSLRADGRSDEARRLLLKEAPQIIGRHPELLDRLVTLTEEALTNKRDDLILQTEAYIHELETEGPVGRSSGLLTRWRELAQRSKQNLREPYRVGKPQFDK
jgi:hypothetical protein